MLHRSLGGIFGGGGGGGGGGSSSMSSGGAFNRETSTQNYNTTNNTTNQTDSRVTAGNGAIVVGQQGVLDQSIRYTDASMSWISDNRVTDNSTRFQVEDNSDRSQTWVDASDRSTNQLWQDYSDRSTSYASDSRDLSTNLWSYDGSNRSVTNITGIDPGAIELARSGERITQYGADLVRDLNARSTDGIRTIAGFGAESMRLMGESATNLYAQASQNFRSVLDQSERTGDKAATVWADTINASKGLLSGILARAGNTVDAAGRLAEAAISNAQPVEGKTADTMRTALLIAAGIGALLILPRLLKKA